MLYLLAQFRDTNIVMVDYADKDYPVGTRFECNGQKITLKKVEIGYHLDKPLKQIDSGFKTACEFEGLDVEKLGLPKANGWIANPNRIPLTEVTA